MKVLKESNRKEKECKYYGSGISAPVQVQTLPYSESFEGLQRRPGEAAICITYYFSISYLLLMADKFK